MVKRPCTPPSGVLVRLPFVLVVNLKRASRTGPFKVMKDGIVLLAPSRFATAICGFTDGLEPPNPGWAWQLEQELELKVGPRPLFAPFWTLSTSWKRVCPSVK